MKLQILPAFHWPRLGAAILIGAISWVFFSRPSDAQGVSDTCEYHAPSQEFGQLPAHLIDEASGLISMGGSRFFVINDSGDEPRFFRADVKGKPAAVEEIKIDGWKPFDLEDLSIGPCPSPLQGECLALADIGDNRESRPSIAIGFFPLSSIPEKIAQPFALKPAQIVRLKYPQEKIAKKARKAAYNAEAFGILDRDQAVIVTKNQSRKSREAEPAKVFFVDLKEKAMRKVGEWDVPTWVKDRGLAGLVTGMSLHPSERGQTQRRMLLLTYRNAIELSVDLTKVEDEKLPNHWNIVSRRVLGLDYLEQQEAIAYNEGGGFFYTTELPMKFLGSKVAPLRVVEKVKCP